MILAHITSNFEYFKANDEKRKDYNIKEDNNIDDEDGIIQGNSFPFKNNIGFIRTRRKTAIIWYFYNNKEDHEQNIKTNMFLFHPFRIEKNKSVSK